MREGRYASRISPQAAVHLAGVLEYLVSEFLSEWIHVLRHDVSVSLYQVAEALELAGDMCRQSKRKRIIPRDIALAIKNDDELVRFDMVISFSLHDFA